MTSSIIKQWRQYRISVFFSSRLISPGCPFIHHFKQNLNAFGVEPNYHTQQTINVTQTYKAAFILQINDNDCIRAVILKNEACSQFGHSVEKQHTFHKIYMTYALLQVQLNTSLINNCRQLGITLKELPTSSQYPQLIYSESVSACSKVSHLIDRQVGSSFLYNFTATTFIYRLIAQKCNASYLIK